MVLLAVESQRGYALENFWTDFAHTLNAVRESSIEISFAPKGSSKFFQATYFETLTAEMLAGLAQEPCNISFLNGCKKAQHRVELGKLIKRTASGECIKERNILSFDADLKDFIADYKSLTKEEKVQKAKFLYPLIVEKIQEFRIPVWFVLY